MNESIFDDPSYKIEINESGLTELAKIFNLVSTGIYTLMSNEGLMMLGDVFKRISDYRMSGTYRDENDQYFSDQYRYLKSLATQICGEKIVFIKELSTHE